MNPETTPVIPRTESAPVVPDVERQYGNQEKSFEQYGAQSVEQGKQPPATPVLPVVDIASLAQPAPQDPASVQTPQTDNDVVMAGVPSIAGDDDLIEKEWVDKLKSLIALTEGNPHERARVIAQLQADYLKKRYNKTLGQSDE
jgi:hypothetical protein cdiviTM7_01500